MDEVVLRDTVRDSLEDVIAFCKIESKSSSSGDLIVFERYWNDMHKYLW